MEINKQNCEKVISGRDMSSMVLHLLLDSVYLLLRHFIRLRSFIIPLANCQHGRPSILGTEAKCDIDIEDTDR